MNLTSKVQRAFEQQRWDEHRQLMKLAYNARTQGNRITPRSTKCPACNEGLKWRFLPHTEETVAICPSCNTMRAFRGDLRSDSRAVGEPYTPGVTGKPRGKCVLKFRADGSLYDPTTDELRRIVR